MINELLFMNGYGVYVLSAFSFTLLSFSALYLITKVQFIKEQNKFVAKFGSLNSEKAKSAKSQKINKEILSFLKNKNLNNPTERSEIETFWEKNIEKKIRKNTKILTLNKGVLTIQAKNPPWRTELSLLKEKIKKKLTKTQKLK